MSIKLIETFAAEDQVVQKMFKDKLIDKPFTTAEFCNIMGQLSSERAKYPEKSFLMSTYKYDVPVYVSTLKDITCVEFRSSQTTKQSLQS